MQSQRKIKIIFDTNWYISASINKKSRQIFYRNILNSEKFEIYYSNDLLKEYKTVIARKKFSKYISQNQVNRLLSILLPKLKKTNSLHYFGVRNIKDNYLIGMCKACKPKFLITGDKDLLEMSVYEKTIILTMRQFLEIIQFL